MEPYIDLIDIIFVPSLNPTPDQISAEVKAISNTVYNAVRNCSQAFASIDQTFA
jgi:hypothetical protein